MSRERRKILLISVLAVVSFWVLEALIHVAVFDRHSSLMDHLIRPGAHELWMRLLVLIAIVAFARYAYSTINRILSAKEDESKALKNANEERAKSDSIIAGIGDGLSIINPQYRIIYQNGVHRALFGDFVNRSCCDLFQCSPRRENCPAAMTFRDGSIHKTERTILGENGRKFVGITSSPLRNGKGEIIACIEIVRDITEERSLKKSLIEIEERERRRIGHDLHDGLGQLLTGLAFKVRGIGRTLENGSVPEAEDVADLSVLIDEAKEQVSFLAKGLSPVVMDEEGLMNALRSLSCYTNKMYRIPCAFSCNEPVSVRDETAVAQLYRIAQEAVTNAVRHAKPDHIEIGLARHNGEVMMTIKDDGIGIPEQRDKSGGMGLKIMKYRAGIISASLDIGQAAGGGTLVTCTMTDISQEDS